MQTQSLRIKFYRSWSANDSSSSQAIARLKKLELFRLEAIFWLKATYCRWRRRKIWKVLTRDQSFRLSISTVGRILTKLLRLNRIQLVSFYFGRVKFKRQCHFKHHTKRWRYGMKAKRPSELIQVDHMSVDCTHGF